MENKHGEIKKKVFVLEYCTGIRNCGGAGGRKEGRKGGREGGLLLRNIGMRCCCFSSMGIRMRFVLELLTFWFVFWFGLLFSV